MSKKSVKEQFGANAAHYIDSRPHAKGASLKRLVETIHPQSHWQMLDIATAAGHTALAFAPHVAHVIAADITPEMLPLARNLAAERGITNLTAEIADAEALPYDSAKFDLVTCRIAPHHFPHIDRFVAEAYRVLKPGGLLGLVDNIVPEGKAGDYVNAFEKLRDPSHGRCLTLAEWTIELEKTGFTIQHRETLGKEMVFESWAARHDAATQAELRRLLREAPPAAGDFLQPQFQGNKTTFRLKEGLFINRKPLN